jgi:3-oxoacyl-[acyl-carrier-protein] synthase-3
MGDGATPLFELVREALECLPEARDVVAVVAATFSNSERFPPLAVRAAAEVGLPTSTPAFDLQMACSAYPYAVYLAARLSSDMGGKVLVIDGDAQTRLVDPSDHATGGIFSDAATCSIVSCGGVGESGFAFLSKVDEALSCSETGPIQMDGMKVFAFVATEVRSFLRDFISASGEPAPDMFVPHQANAYMVRQLAKSLGLEDRLLALDPGLKNPGSCSIPLTIAKSRESAAGGSVRFRRVLVAGFGAGLSASAAMVDVLQCGEK